MMEYETARDAFQQEQSPINSNSLDHAQQRLALAEMGVEAKAARFERIQRKLEELAEIRYEIIAQPPLAVDQKTETHTDSDRPDVSRDQLAESATLNAPPTHASHPPMAVMNDPPPTENKPVNSAPSLADTDSDFPKTPQLAPVPLVKKILQQAAPPTPVLTQQGKVSDVYQLNAELQKLEEHLIAHGATAQGPIQAKVFGTAIAGEIPLMEMGGNQFFARFTAPAGEASLIVGARHPEGYVRTELKMMFSAEEAGKEFVLIFDINTTDQPRTLVFQESLAFTQELFASHSDF